MARMTLYRHSIVHIACVLAFGFAATSIGRADKAGDAPAVAAPADKADPATEWKRSRPDIVVYRPRGEAHHDTDNEHFLVQQSHDGTELLAFWTQSSCEGHGDNRIMMSRSSNGHIWSQPQKIVGTEPGEHGGQASWGVPIMSRAGRLYLFYTRQTDRVDGDSQGCGRMGCVYSDDDGRTWSEAKDIPMPRNHHDHADAAVPKHWIAWQLPIRDRKGRLIMGYTQDTSPTRLGEKNLPWYAGSSRCQFMRFENLDDNPDPGDIEITWLPDNEDGLMVPHPNHDWSAAQEPSLVRLRDGRLFVVMRTWTGNIWYSVSDDDGATWRKPEVLRYHDGGEPVEHPLAPCPVYALRDGRYLLLFHNNDGEIGNRNQREKRWRTNHLNFLRNPAFIAVGEFRPDAHQPIWFSQPKKILDTDGVPVGPKGTAEIATYTSLTEWLGTRILWYPDRKYYLLGRILPDSLLADMRVPGSATSDSEALAAKPKQGETFGAHANPTGDPIGGGLGYRNIVESHDRLVRTREELLCALATAKAGQTVYVADDAEIDLTGFRSIHIPGGITLASGRGRDGSVGGLLFTNEDLATPRGDVEYGVRRRFELFRLGGPDVRITGLRLRGPDTARRGRYQFINSDGIYTDYDNLEVDNCELWGWSHGGVWLGNGTGFHIHHNLIHHCQRGGLGYGVVLNTAEALIEANIFDWCRHAIAGTGRSPSGYEARYNLVLEHANGHNFDMHRCRDRRDEQNISVAGDWIKIHHNTFYGSQVPVKIRGKPAVGCEVHHNWFANKSSPSNAVQQINAEGNMTVDRNQYTLDRLIE